MSLLFFLHSRLLANDHTNRNILGRRRKEANTEDLVVIETQERGKMVQGRFFSFNHGFLQTNTRLQTDLDGERKDQTQKTLVVRGIKMMKNGSRPPPFF